MLERLSQSKRKVKSPANEREDRSANRASLIDMRASSAEQKNLQLKVELNTRNMPRADLAHPKTSPSIQLRKEVYDGNVLQNGHLHVAGEDHSVSDERRMEESEFVDCAINGGYWTEAEFEDIEDHPADEPLLRLAQDVIRIAESMEDYIIALFTYDSDEDDLVPYDPDKDDEVPAEEEDDHSSERSDIGELMDEAMESYNNEYPSCLEVYQQNNGVRPHLVRINGIVNRSVEAFVALYRRHENNEIDNREQLEVFMNRVLHCAVRGIPEIEHAREYIKERRSSIMHDAANGKSGENGVWKVGQLHIEDMRHYGGRHYKLIEQDIFDADYENWEEI